MKKEISSTLLEARLLKDYGNYPHAQAAFQGFTAVLLDSVVRMRACEMEDKYIVDHILKRVDERTRGV